jgi:tryptophan synthase beta chain
MHAHLYTSGRGEFHSITDDEAMEAGRELAALEGIIPAIETSHAFAVLTKRKFRPEDLLVFNLSGRGDKDLQTYINFFDL